MRLSDTTNPKTGNPFTREQLTKGAAHHALTWKTDNSDDPELSAPLVQAITEIGWDNPNKTLHRAAIIAAAPQTEHWKAESRRLSKIDNRPRRNTQTWSDDDDKPTYI